MLHAARTQRVRRSSEHFPCLGWGRSTIWPNLCPGGTKLVGFHTAAHAVAVTAGPAVLMDFTVDQLNRLPPARVHGLQLPSRVIRRLPGALNQLKAAEVFPAPGWTARYHHIREDADRLPDGWKPEARHVAPVVEIIRQRLGLSDISRGC